MKLEAKLRSESPLEPAAFIAVFHRWIRERRVEGTLIDVADYTHVPGGPGVILVGLEGDYAIDESGLTYRLKRPGIDAVERVREAAAILEAEEGARFERDRVRVQKAVPLYA